MEKCSFSQQEVEFLGQRISNGKLMMDPNKVKTIQEWQPPSKIPELRSFLGLVNYYRRFVKGYSAIAAPLTELLKKMDLDRRMPRCVPTTKGNNDERSCHDPTLLHQTI